MPYFHVVFTVPDLIASIAFQNQTVVYDILFRAASETLRTIRPPIRSIWAQRSRLPRNCACTRGDKTCCRTLTHDTWHYQFLHFQ